jgi:hypothetical protein
MKNLLKTLDGCLHNVVVMSKYTANNCHISLTGGGNRTIYILSRVHRLPLGGNKNFCVAIPQVPEIKFTGISLDGECGRKNSTKAGTITPPFS